MLKNKKIEKLIIQETLDSMIYHLYKETEIFMLEHRECHDLLNDEFIEAHELLMDKVIIEMYKKYIINYE